MEWRTIETVPKDGTRIMLANRHGIWMAEYCPVYPSGYRPDDPWFSVMLNHDHIQRTGRHDKPTHWMPLPEPPEVGDGS